MLSRSGFGSVGPIFASMHRICLFYVIFRSNGRISSFFSAIVGGSGIDFPRFLEYILQSEIRDRNHQGGGEERSDDRHPRLLVVGGLQDPLQHDEVEDRGQKAADHHPDDENPHDIGELLARFFSGFEGDDDIGEIGKDAGDDKGDGVGQKRPEIGIQCAKVQSDLLEGQEIETHPIHRQMNSGVDDPDDSKTEEFFGQKFRFDEGPEFFHDQMFSETSSTK